MNRMHLIGYLGADPEVRETRTGVKVTSFRVAHSRYWIDKQSGERQQETFWLACVAYARTAEALEKMADGGRLRKGTRIAVEGFLRTEKWEKQDGTPQERTVCQLEGFTMLDNPQRDDDSAPQRRESTNSRPTQASRKSQQDDFGDDDIPF